MVIRAGLALAIALLHPLPVAAVTLTGVNLAGGEFGGLQAVYGMGYVYPDAAQMRAFRDTGMNIFRVPVRWERLQPELGKALSETEMARIDALIATASGLGVSVIIDVHNYARYARQPIGGPAVPVTALPDLWQRLAMRYKDNSKVIFGLMNEPVRINATDWAAVAKASLTAIRSTGARNLVLVPGAYWSGAHSWQKTVGGPVSNAAALADLTDPANNMAIDFHQYFDANSSGTSPLCVPPAEAERRLAVATNWMRATGHRGMLTEFGVSRDPGCAIVLTTALRHLADNPEWLGWTIWASSAWFGAYPFNLYPFQASPPPQLQALQPFLAAPPHPER